MTMYDTIQGMRDTLEEMIAGYPPELMALVGGMVDLFSPSGFVNTYLFSYMPLILGVFAVLVGSSMLASDEESGRLDLIMGYPISRTRLYAARLLAMITATLAILLLIWAGLVLGAQGTSIDVTPWALAGPVVSLFALLAFFSTFAVSLSLYLPSQRMAATGAGLLLVISFFMTALARMNEQLAWAEDVSPLSYFQGGLAVDGLNWGWVAGLVGIATLFAMVGWWRFRGRDVRVAGEGGWRLPLLRRGKASQATDPRPSVA
jgi:ABC-2 type transport system permease protein